MIIGGSLCTLNLLQGTPYMPDLRDKVPQGIPVVFGADFGHVFPMFTFPIGGTAEVKATPDGVELRLVRH